MFLMLLAAGPAHAGPVERILDDLGRLGYDHVEVEKTMLGRTRILASSDDADREIIVNPVTGEILRDLWTPRSGTGSGAGLTGGTRKRSSSTSDDSDDDDADDDGGDDNSGKGSDGDSDSDGDDDGGGDDNSGNSGTGGGDDDD